MAHPAPLKKILILDENTNGAGSYAWIFRPYGDVVARPSVQCSKQEVEDSSMVIFTGGCDVSPSMYGEVPHRTVQWTDHNRDDAEKNIFNWCVGKGIPMVGICRGGQFGTVMNGGRLLQHVEGHTGNQSNTHACSLVGYDVSIQVSSDHHQIMVPPEDSTKYELLAIDGPNQLPEVIWYKDTEFLAIQYHPEWMNYSSVGLNYFRFIMRKYAMGDVGYTYARFSPTGSYLPYVPAPHQQHYKAPPVCAASTRVPTTNRTKSISPPLPEAVTKVV